MLLAYYFQDNQLMILRLRASTSEELQSLLRAGADIAQRHGLETIALWDAPDQLIKSLGLENQPRDESIPQISFYHPNSQQLTWMQCQKYAWC